MKYAAVLAALALVPITAAVAWTVKPDPASPTFPQYMTDAGVKYVEGNDSDDWLATAVTGPHKGGAMDLAMALSAYPTHKALEQSAGGKVIYVEMKCQNYTTTGRKKLSSADKLLVRRCTQSVRTRKQAEDYMVSLFTPAPKG